jgi:HK97 family phage portal protein
MAWQWPWISRSFRATDAQYLAEIYGGGAETAGELVTPHAAMRLSAFWACTRLISQIIATLPLNLYQKLPNGERKSLDAHPLTKLLRESPNADQTALEFWERRVQGLCVAGNGFAEKVYSGKRLISLQDMPSDTIVRRLDDGSLEYRYQYLGKEVVLKEDNVFHIRGFGDGTNFCGLSPVAHARQTLGLAIATDRAAAQTFSKGMRAKGFFTSPNVLNAEQRTQAQKALVDPFSGPNGKDWGILEAGFDLKMVNISPRDAELVLSRKFNVEDICRWFGVPPIMIGHQAQGSTSWGTGIEQIMLGFYKTGLIPYLERIEQRINKSLLSPDDRAIGIYAEFNVEALLRGDSKSVTDNLKAQIEAAMRTPNEARAKLNLPKQSGGDELLASLNLIPLKDLGTQRAAVPTVPAGPGRTTETPLPPEPSDPGQTG